MISKKLKVNNEYSVLNADYLTAFIKNNPYAVFAAAVFNDNNKLNGIAAINFETAFNCSSNKLKLCSICKKCYAISDAKKYDIHHKNTIETAALISAVQSSPELFNLFDLFLKNMEVTILRYNIVGDFKNSDNISFLKELCILNPEIKFYGYTKRADLQEPLKDILNSCNNFYVGCSKKLYKKLKEYGANYYNTVNSVKKFMESKNRCKGSCLSCCKCFSLKGEVITCFIHGAPSYIQRDINTAANNKYLTGLINSLLNINIEVPASGLFINKYNKVLEAEGFAVPFKINSKGKKIYTNNNLTSFLKWLKFQAAAAAY